MFKVVGSAASTTWGQELLDMETGKTTWSTHRDTSMLISVNQCFCFFVVVFFFLFLFLLFKLNKQAKT